MTLRRVFGLALFTLVASCSSLRLGYNNADTLLVYTFDKYLELNDRQEQVLRERARALLAWHRATQLRGYAEFLEAAGKRVEGQVSADEVLAFNLEMNRRLVMVGQQAAADLASIALTLEPAQLSHLEKKLADDNAKSRREWGAGDGRHSAREKRNVERVEEWFGSVSPQQHALIRRALATRPEGDEWWVIEREQRRSDLLKLLQRIQAEHPSQEEATRRLREYFDHLTEPQDAERRARMNEYRRYNAELVAALVNAATPEQRATLLKKLHGYAEDFTTLASTGAARG